MNTKHQDPNVTRELQKFIGRTMRVKLKEGCSVNCQCEDIRLKFGRVDLKLRPISGTGTAWFALTTLNP